MLRFLEVYYVHPILMGVISNLPIVKLLFIVTVIHAKSTPQFKMLLAIIVGYINTQIPPDDLLAFGCLISRSI